MKNFTKFLTIFFIVILGITSSSFAFCPASLVPESINCEGQGNLKWTGPFYSPNDNIVPNGQKAVSIEGGCPPYVWSVNADGYWLENELTYDHENIVYADSVADCAVSITVVDKYGHRVTGYLRRPGQWVSIGNTCQVPGPPTRELGYNRHTGWQYERIEGGLRQYQSYRFDTFSGTCLWTEPPCGNQGYSCVPKTDPGLECITLDWTPGYDRKEYPCVWQSPEAWSESNDNYDHSYCTNRGSMGWTSMVCIYSKNLRAEEWRCD